MRKKVILLFTAAMIFSVTLPAQKIMMKINGITVKDGEEVKALEFQINAQSSWTSGGGVSVGKPNPGSLIVKKNHGLSTNELFKKIASGSAMPEVVFEYYDAGNVLYYSITLGDVLLTQMYWLSPECPSCLKLEHQAGFVFKTYKTIDVINNVTTTWNIASGTVQ